MLFLAPNARAKIVFFYDPCLLRSTLLATSVAVVRFPLAALPRVLCPFKLGSNNRAFYLHICHDAVNRLHRATDTKLLTFSNVLDDRAPDLDGPTVHIRCQRYIGKLPSPQSADARCLHATAARHGFSYSLQKGNK